MILSAGDHYFILPYTPHSLSSIGKNEFSYKVLCVKIDSLSKQADDTLIFAKNCIEKADNGFNIDSLSSDVCLSKYHLTRTFKERFGVTPYQYYISEKIKKIRQGLRSQLSLSDLTFDLGFSDQSHLCNTFKKHMGISPLQYVYSCRQC